MGILAVSATMQGILYAIMIVGGVGLIIGIVLGIAGKFLAVQVDEKEAAIMEMTISQGNPGQVPSLVERIRDSGVFRSVSHSNWEQEEDNDAVRIHASIRAVLKEEAQDEEK